MSDPRPGARRVVTSGGWRIAQIRQADGSWLNATIDRVKG